MPRLARTVVPEYPRHVTQRGNRRQRTFFCDDDHEAYLTQPTDGIGQKLQQHERTGRPLGNEAFLTRVESLLNRGVKPRTPGRKPKKHGKQVWCPPISLDVNCPP